MPSESSPSPVLDETNGKGFTSHPSIGLTSPRMDGHEERNSSQVLAWKEKKTSKRSGTQRKRGGEPARKVWFGGRHASKGGRGLNCNRWRRSHCTVVGQDGRISDVGHVEK
mmetsp:Transcript_8811/g.54163  ORF Transcript_8811/g.54163 Transcript_8811/m.54163 type:complete len:111 (-) Transcript_8811:1121-1453(-)